MQTPWVSCYGNDAGEKFWHRAWKMCSYVNMFNTSVQPTISFCALWLSKTHWIICDVDISMNESDRIKKTILILRKNKNLKHNVGDE